MSERKYKLPMKPCEVCGKMFQPSKTNHACCGNACRKKRLRMQNRDKWSDYYARKKAEQNRTKSNHDKIVEIDALARKEGLSYGQYVEKYMGKV